MRASQVSWEHRLRPVSGPHATLDGAAGLPPHHAGSYVGDAARVHEPWRHWLCGLPRSPGEGQAFNDWPSAVFVEMRRQRVLVSVNADPDTAAQMARIGADWTDCAVLFSHLGRRGDGPRPPSLAAARRGNCSRLSRSPPEHIVKFSGLYAICRSRPRLPSQGGATSGRSGPGRVRAVTAALGLRLLPGARLRLIRSG